jgi:hypothetical protein
LERFRPFENDERLHFLVAPSDIPLINLNFRRFAYFPLALVFFGVTVAVPACFWISHKVIDFANRADELKKHEIVQLQRNLAQLITLTSIVFTTSTIATIALMQIGRDWIDRGNVRDAYIQNGHAMSIFWSACYTAVIAAMVLIPVCWIAGYTKRIQRQAKYSGGRASFYDQISDVTSYKSLFQAGTAMLGPLLTSSVAAVFGS